MKNNSGKRVLALLRKSRGKAISGEAISRSLGISRSAVWKQVNTLRDLGYRISARPHNGYCLEEEPDQFDENALAAEAIIFRHSVASTNLTARRLAEEGAPSGTTLIADQQLAGKGRLGRSWFSPAGSGLWFSIIFRPQALTPAAVSPVTLVTAAVLADCLSGSFNLPVNIKWPNDLQVRGKKLAGILTEINGDLDRLDYLVIGIGLNVNQIASDFPATIAGAATSLALETGLKINRTTLFLNLRKELLAAYRVFEKEGFTPFRQSWISYNITLGREVKISWPGGSLTGLASELTEDGRLMVIDHLGRIELINYGEVN